MAEPTPSDLAALSACDLFAHMDAARLETFLAATGSRVRVAEKGAVLMRAGSKPRDIGVVAAGRVEVARTEFDGRRSVLASVGPSGMFAEMFAAAGAASLPVDVVAAEPSRVCLVPYARFVAVSREDPAALENLVAAIARKTVGLSDKVRYLSRKTTAEKLLAYLSDLSARIGSPVVTVPFDRQGLADFLGVDRSALSTVISRLRRQGVLASKGSRFELLDRDAPEYVPNETTLRAMVGAQAKELGLIPDDSPSFTNADDAIAYLESQ
jgi:CRP-like cAMP-binding protein